jgi:hypothetical protein
MKKETKERLIKIADYLDSNGREEDADLIDGLANPDAIEIPEDEADYLEMVFESLRESLGK